jgi:hypothetical protein
VTERAEAGILPNSILRFSLQAGLLGGGHVSGLLQHPKLFFGQSALEKENAVHVAMECVVAVNGGDELKVPA